MPHTKPPVIPELVAKWLLPPSCRTQVLGDLEERFRLHGAARQYWLDAASALSRVLWSRLFSKPQTRGNDLRRRAEAFQDSLWARQLRLLAVTLAMFALMTGPNIAKGHFPWVASALLVALTVYSLVIWKDASGRHVPGALSEDELRTFHRIALLRHRDLLRALTWRGFQLYGFFAIVVMLTPMLLTLPSFTWGVSVFPLGTLAIFGLVRQRTAVLKYLETLQQEIDSLGPAS